MHKGREVANSKVNCKYCDKVTNRANIKRHENSCSKNPDNLKECPVCSKLFAGNSVTCGYSCSNTYFKKVRNKDERLNYRSLCFRYHDKKCLVCGEDKVVAVHHVNEDHSDNRPENLVPLCPTHHQYIHSQYKDEVQPIIDSYLAEFRV